VNFSYNWLAELVDGLTISPADLLGLITLKTAECEGLHVVAPHLSKVCAARVESIEPISGSRNVKAVVDTGQYGRKTVVCGAPNCRPGMVTAYVPVGATLGGKEIRKVTISSIESEGMLASGAELGISRDSAGLLELNIEPGASLGLDPDHIIEVDNKSLTHRPDLWGHHGMAREVAAITQSALREPAELTEIPEGEAAISVRIEDLDLCPRYSALVFDNVTVGPSPLWLQYRLEAIGLNPINNIVDVTNYVMAEIAQPMHAFDADKLNGGIVVRRASDGESIVALNGDRYALTPQHLVIADEQAPVAIAGVIGGLDSAIGTGTKRIVFESANFNAGNVRRTSSALRLRTDASMRFEKSQDPVNTVRGLARAVALLHEVSPGIRLVGGLADVFRRLPAPQPIQLPLHWLDRKIGRHVEPAEVRRILEALQFTVEERSQNVLSVSVPSWRATKDISIKDDLVEEVGRMIGYASIPPSSPMLPASVPPTNELRQCLHATRRLVAAQGFDEVYNYSFVNEDLLSRFGLAPDDHVRVLNPIAADQTHLRTTLIPGLWKHIVENIRYFDDFRLFETGVEIHKQLAPELPRESNHLCAAVYHKDGGTEGLFELKRLAQCLLRDIEARPVQARSYEHPARAAELVLYGEQVGRLFEFHPSMIERGRAAVLDVDLDAIMRLCRRDRKYKPLQRYPSSAFDLSVIAPARAHVGDIGKQLSSFAGAHLDSLDYLRQYSGPPLREGTKSVSYRLTLAAPDRTLASQDVSAIRQKIIDGMRELGYELRV
jgi:phenylalanyl-tRNA synthetase beta chain